MYRCEICGATFAKSDDLRSHRFNDHPLKRPILMIRGLELGDRPLQVTHALSPAEVQILHAEHAEVNGRPVTLDGLPAHLASMKQTTAKFRLRDAESTVSFTIHFAIASDADVVGLEHTFREVASRGRLDLRSIDDFIRMAKKYPTAQVYCDGICQYLCGMLAKERSPESSLPYEEYREKLNRASNALWDVDRVLAKNFERQC